MSKLFNCLLQKRGLSDNFLFPDYDKMCDAFLLPDMDKAISRILLAIQTNERILIYGDYDVDGITSSVVMEQALVLAGVRPDNINIMLPDRFADGYGMSTKIISNAKKNNVGLVITVDCGSSNFEIIEELSKNNIDTIVTDHHECPEKLPSAIAVVNPKRSDFDGFRDLAGVGVAFKVAMALVCCGLIPKGQEKWLLDLVLIGTICDNMPLVGENRILCFYGMKVLAKTKRVGLLQLLKNANINKISSEAIGFQLGPRLNAAGRIETAQIGLDLLRTKNRAEAFALADKMEELNKKRKNEQQVALSEIEKRTTISDYPVIVEVGNWHEGVLGIVAGRLVEEYNKPAFVLSKVSEGILKGSGRSFGDFNLANALNYCRENIINGGGHAMAAGVQIDEKNIDIFREQINEYYKSLKLVEQEKFLYIHEDLEVYELKDLNLDFLDELRQLEPFGNGNNEPIFRLKNVEILEVRRMGTDGKHLSMTINGNGQMLRLIAFFANERWFNVRQNERYDILITVLENEWQGTRSVEGRILEIFSVI